MSTNEGFKKMWCEKTKEKVPDLDAVPARDWLTYERIKEVLGEDEQKEYDAMYEQTAHKDIVKGPFMDVNPYLPVQGLLALDTEFEVKIWKDTNGVGNLRLYDNKSEWERLEAKTFRPLYYKVKPGHIIWFHAKQTHAGTAKTSNFRLFISMTRTPEGASFNDALQSYYELEKEANEHYGAYQQAMAYLKPDFNPFSEEIKSQTPTDAKRVWTPADIKGPAGYNQLTYCLKVREAWEELGHQRQLRRQSQLEQDSGEQPSDEAEASLTTDGVNAAEGLDPSGGSRV